MDARELTKYVYRLNDTLYDIIKRLELLEDQYNKLKREVDDLSIDFKMFEHMNRR